MTKLINKVVIVNDRRTSIRLCHKEWEALDELCNMENISKNDLLSLIENGKRNSSLNGNTFISVNSFSLHGGNSDLLNSPQLLP